MKALLPPHWRDLPTPELALLAAELNYELDTVAELGHRYLYHQTMADLLDVEHELQDRQLEDTE